MSYFKFKIRKDRDDWGSTVLVKAKDMMEALSKLVQEYPGYTVLSSFEEDIDDIL